MPISTLNTTDTFKTWYERTNEIISQVNGITIYNIIPGDGISLTNNGGNVYTIKHGTSVGTPVTFTGPVTFTNTVSFSASPTVNNNVISYTPKVSGITIGNVVRTTSTGLTLSKADTAENAEILGIVVNSDASTYTIATSGSIDNTLFSATIPNLLGIAGGTLSPGCSYFLNSDVAGGITSIEPTNYGYVSKPVILGITYNSGLFLPHRGIRIEGISAGITAELDNKIVISLDYSSPALSPSGTVKIGDPVVYYEDSASNSLSADFNTTGSSKITGKLNNAGNNNAAVCGALGASTILTSKRFLGLISKILSNVSSVYVFEVTLPGGSFNVNWNDLDTNLYVNTKNVTSSLAISDTDNTFTGDTSLQNKFLDYIVTDVATNSAKIILSNTTSGAASSSIMGRSTVATASATASGTTFGLEYENLVPNGSFTIWQRTWSDLVGVTAAGLSAFNTPIADRWFYIIDSTNITGLTATIQRQSFDSNQITVPGSPRYWLDVKQTFSSAALDSYRPRLENIQKGARLLQGQETTVTFYAKSAVAGTSLDIFYNRYADSYASSAETRAALQDRTTFASGVTLGASWQKYSYTFTPTGWGTTLSNTQEGWFSLGFEFPAAGVTCSLAQVKLELGSDTTDYVYASPETELERCSPYYLRTYKWDQNTGYSGTSKLNEHYLTLGNLLSQKVYTVKFPVDLVQTPYSVTLYSTSGTKDEAYNQTKQADMRYPRCEGCPIHVNLPWDTSTQRTSLPSGNITVQSLSKNGAQVVINNGATHLDTLVFHYVADADIKLT